MTLMKSSIIASASVCALVALGQTLPSTFPARQKGFGTMGVDRSRSESATRVFRIHGKEYASSMSWNEVNSAPAWQPTSPMPLNLESVEEIARKQLRNLASDEVRWQLTEFSVNRFPGNGSPLWYFTITMKPALAVGESNSDFFTLVLNSSGEPGIIAGFVGKLSQ